MTSSHSQEDLGRILLSEDEKFILKPHPNPRRAQKVVWYKFPDRAWGDCKIDMFTPDTFDIPIMSNDQFAWFDNKTIASIPLLHLLLLTLYGYECHLNAPHRNRTLELRQHSDVVDIEALLGIARKRKVHRRDVADLLPASLLSETDRRVLQFTQSFGTTSINWEALGFKAAKGPDDGLGSAMLQFAHAMGGSLNS
jgi:hypothetical protein